MSNKFDTAELNDIRRMLGEDIPEPAPVQKAAPAPSAAPRQEAPRPAAKPSAAPTAGSYNLDDILAEVSGVVDMTRAEQEARKPEPPRFTDAASPAAPPARPAREPAPAQKAAPARAAVPAADDREAEASEPSARPARRAACGGAAPAGPPPEPPPAPTVGVKGIIPPVDSFPVISAFHLFHTVFHTARRPPANAANPLQTPPF